MKPTTEQALQWAREAGIQFLTHEGIAGKLNTSTRGSQPIKNIEAALALAYLAGAAAMKERAAKVCADLWCKEPEPGDARDCYDAIRALGDDCATDKAEHKWVCPKCKVDRLKEDCKGDRMRCPMVGEAYGAIRALGDKDE